MRAKAGASRRSTSSRTSRSVASTCACTGAASARSRSTWGRDRVPRKVGLGRARRWSPAFVGARGTPPRHGGDGMSAVTSAALQRVYDAAKELWSWEGPEETTPLDVALAAARWPRLGSLADPPWTVIL